jgi:2-keto-3-deoxy-L-fuconate dehydrogenase
MMAVVDHGRLAGKHCAVTGAAQGIGRAIAEAFASEGAQVLAADLRFPEPLTRAGITAKTVDATDANAVTELARRHPQVSVLVNCVGYVATGTLLECTPEDFDRSMTLNVRSMFLVTRSFLPAMLERQQGSIINIASVVSSVMAAPVRFAYGTSKAAVVGLTMSVARDYVTQGIRCNSISPGTVDSPSLHQRFARTGDIEKARQAFIARQPMGRLGQGEEIAATALLLASDEATFMTRNIIIDEGMSL